MRSSPLRWCELGGAAGACCAGWIGGRPASRGSLEMASIPPSCGWDTHYFVVGRRQVGAGLPSPTTEPVSSLWCSPSGLEPAWRRLGDATTRRSFSIGRWNGSRRTPLSCVVRSVAAAACGGEKRDDLHPRGARPLGGLNKDAAVRASETTRVSELLSQLLGDLARLGTDHQPRLDYLDSAALDAVRSDPEPYLSSGGLPTPPSTVARASSPLLTGATMARTRSTWNWRSRTTRSSGGLPWRRFRPGSSHHLRAIVDCREGRIERLELG